MSSHVIVIVRELCWHCAIKTCLNLHGSPVTGEVWLDPTGEYCQIQTLFKSLQDTVHIQNTGETPQENTIQILQEKAPALGIEFEGFCADAAPRNMNI